MALDYSSGRNWAGIHWRSDAAASVSLGEAAAIAMLRDERATYREEFEGFSFMRFDGSRVTIESMQNRGAVFCRHAGLQQLHCRLDPLHQLRRGSRHAASPRPTRAETNPPRFCMLSAR